MLHLQVKEPGDLTFHTLNTRSGHDERGIFELVTLRVYWQASGLFMGGSTYRVSRDHVALDTYHVSPGRRQAVATSSGVLSLRHVPQPRSVRQARSTRATTH